MICAGGKPDPKSGDERKWADWIVFGFLIWMANSNFDNNAAKWDLCSDLGRYVSESTMPDSCFEKYYADD